MTTCAHQECSRNGTHKVTWLGGLDTDRWCPDHVAPIYTDEWATTGRLEITQGGTVNPAPSLATCGYDGCDTPTQEYLCHTCVEELDQDWQNIPDLLPVLHNIVSGKDVPFHTPTAEQRGGPTGSRPPINLTALQLAADLEYAHTITPQQWAQDRHGPKYKQRIHRWVTNANRLVYGEPENADSKANIAKYKLRDIQPMPVKHLLPWLNEHAGVRLTTKQVNKWHQRGKLERRNTTGHPTYHPADVLEALANDGRSA